MIVRFEDTLFAVIHQPKHARLFDRRPDQRNRFGQRHLQPLCVLGRFVYIRFRSISPGNRSAQNTSHRGSTDLKPPGDLCLGDAAAMQFADLGGMQSRR